MASYQFIPKVEARPGDLVRLRDDNGVTDVWVLPKVVRLDHGKGVYITDSNAERFVSFESIERVVRPLPY